MKKILYTALFVNCLFLSASAQNLGFKYSNNLKFLDANNDTVPYPFTGGLIAPQFNSIDIDLDGKKDLLVFDRSGNMIHPYINKGATGQVKYEYAPQYRNKFPKLVNWVRLYDYNNDGKEDIITAADPDAPRPSGMLIQANEVRVFKNTSSGGQLTFDTVSYQLSCIFYTPPSTALTISRTDMPDVGDVDGDGDMDIIYMLSVGVYVELAKNYQVEMSLPPDSFRFYIVDRCWGSIRLTSQVTLRQSCNKTYFKANHGGGTTLSLFDTDGDGDMDLYFGDAENDFTYFIHNDKKERDWKYKGFPADTMTAYDSIFPSGTLRAQFPYAHVSYFIDINNDGKKDLIMAPNLMHGMSTKNQVWYYENTGTTTVAAWTFRKKNFLQDETTDLGMRFAPALLDYDQDGDMDLLAGSNGDWQYTGNTKDQLFLFKNVGNQSYPVYKMTDSNYLDISSLGLIDIKPATGDMDGDGKPEIVLGDLGGSITYLQNTTSSASGHMTFAAAVKNFKNISVNGNSAPAVYDMNFDGKGDLLVGVNTGNIHYYRNLDSIGFGCDFSSTPVADSLGKISSRDKPPFGDASPFVYNAGNDSMLEIMVGSKRGRVRSYRMNAGLETVFAEIDSILMPAGDSIYGNAFLSYNSDALKCAPLVADFDADSIPDMLVGLHNGGLFYFKGYFRSNLPPITGRDTIGSPFISAVEAIHAASPGLQIFPNPVEGLLHIKRTKPNGPVMQIRIYDVLGREVCAAILGENDIELLMDVSVSQPGLLFIRSSEGDGPGQVYKLVKY